jgi:hypothetical protein
MRNLAAALRIADPLVPLGLLLMGAVRLVAILLTQYWPTAPGPTNAEGQVLGRDFLFFWTAGSLGVRGDLATIFDPAALSQAMQAAIPSNAGPLPWLYLPTLLLLLLPLRGFQAAAKLGLLPTPFIVIVLLPATFRRAFLCQATEAGVVGPAPLLVAEPAGPR